MKYSSLLLLFLVSFYATSQTIKSKKMKFLALGDSYTIGESVAESERWPVQLVNRLNADGGNFEAPTIIATTGWRTHDLKNAINAKKPSHDYDLVSLLIGVNNQYQGKPLNAYEEEFEELLNIAIDHAGGNKSKVFVVSIPDYGFTPFGKSKQEQVSKAIDDFNAVNKKITESKGISYVEITDISRQGFDDPALVASDGLHPSGKMYSLWVERIFEKVR
jgi:lysophospholipase L1-like esterase